MDMDVFERDGITVEWQAYTSATYEQLFPQLGFVPDLSVLDVCSAAGPMRRRSWRRPDDRWTRAR